MFAKLSNYKSTFRGWIRVVRLDFLKVFDYISCSKDLVMDLRTNVDPIVETDLHLLLLMLILEESSNV